MKNRTLGNVFCVNDIHVGVHDTQPIFNCFQMILTDRSDIAAGDFDIQFNHDTIVWETGTACDAPAGGLCDATCTSALVGYWTSPTSTATLPGSLVHGALINGGPNALVSHSLNSNILGQYNFQVRGGNVANVPEPASWRSWAWASPAWRTQSPQNHLNQRTLRQKRRPDAAVSLL